MQQQLTEEQVALRTMMQTFIKKHPQHAKQMNLSSVDQEDPYVTRLLEGLAKLNSTIQQTTDGHLPDIAESLLTQVAPEFLRVYPSATIAQFTAQSNQIRQTTYLPKGTVITSDPVGEERAICRFRTTSAVKVNPLCIIKVETSHSHDGQGDLKLYFQCQSKDGMNHLDLAQLRLYLHSQNHVAKQLYQLLTSELVELKITFSENNFQESIALGDQSLCCPTLLDINDAMLPSRNNSFYGFHLLHDYFLFPQKYLFIELHGLEELVFPEACTEFMLEFKLQQPLPQGYQIESEDFQLHCVPAINLYGSASEPIHLSLQKEEYSVVADASQPNSMNIFSVDNVYGHHVDGTKTLFKPMHAFHHRNTKVPVYQTYTRTDGEKFPVTSLAFNETEDMSGMTLSCDITVCNGNYPAMYLTAHTINQLQANVSSDITVTNLTKPTTLVLPPDSDQLAWSLVSHLSLNYQSLAELDNFKNLLARYDWASPDIHESLFDSIFSVRVKPTEFFQKGVFMRGLSFSIGIEEERLEHESELYLFGTVLHHFLTMYGAMNSFVKTDIICHPSNKVLQWQPILGKQ